VIEEAGQLTRFLAGVGLECGSVFDDFGGLRPGSQVAQLQAEVSQDFLEFFLLFLIAGSQDEDHRQAYLPFQCRLTNSPAATRTGWVGQTSGPGWCIASIR